MKIVIEQLKIHHTLISVFFSFNCYIIDSVEIYLKLQKHILKGIKTKKKHYPKNCTEDRHDRELNLAEIQEEFETLLINWFQI